MSEQEEVSEITLPVLPVDGGMVEAARYRVGLAMLITMLAEMAEDVGPIKVEMLHDLAANVVNANERGMKLINAHAFKMGSIRFELPTQEEEGETDA